MSKAGMIPKLNKQSVSQLRIFTPALRTQRTMLEIETRITAEQNTLLGLQNEIGDLQRELWNNPRSTAKVADRLQKLSVRLAAGLKEHAAAGLDQWFESLPFPLASILRAWQATPSR